MQRIKIFLVDDEAIAIRHFQRVLNKGSDFYEVAGTAEHGAAALKKIEQVKPDVVFADVQMPVMDGLELAEEIKKQYPTMKVILLTAYKDFSYAQRGMNAGVYAYLVKHEITREQVEGILRNIHRELGVETAQKRAWLEKNVKAFLLGEEDMQKMELGYQQYSFLLLDVVARHPLCLAGSNGGFGDFPVKRLEREVRTEDIFCRAAVKMSENSCAVMLFLKKGLYEGNRQYQLHRILNMLQKFLAEAGLDTVVLASEVLEYFGELPAIWQGQRKYEPYIYGSSGKKRIFSEEWRDSPRDYNAFIRFRDSLPRGKGGYGRGDLKKLFTLGREACTIEQYLGELNTLAVQMILLGEKLCIPETDGWKAKRQQEFSGLDALEEWLLEGYGICLARQESLEQSAYSETVQRGLLFMQREYASALTSEEICAYLNISESHFRRIFKQEVGMKPMEYLNTCRIEAAKRLLRDGQSRIQDVYERVGFSTSQYFSTVFKKITGVSPWQYQQRKAAGNDQKDDTV